MGATTARRRFADELKKKVQTVKEQETPKTVTKVEEKPKTKKRV